MIKDIEFLKENDAVLKNLIENTTLETIRWSGDLFEDLISCILDGQIRYRGTAKKFNCLKTVLDGARINYSNIKMLSNSQLHKLYINAQQYNAIINLSDHWAENNLSFFDWYECSDDTIRTMLIDIEGINTRIIDLILLYTFQRPDIFPIDDSKLQKAMKVLYNIDAEKDLRTEIAAISNNWKPFRSTAVLYLLKS